MNRKCAEFRPKFIHESLNIYDYARLMWLLSSLSINDLIIFSRNMRPNIRSIKWSLVPGAAAVVSATTTTSIYWYILTFWRILLSVSACKSCHCHFIDICNVNSIYPEFLVLFPFMFCSLTLKHTQRPKKIFEEKKKRFVLANGGN